MRSVTGDLAPLRHGLAQLRTELGLPTAFPPDVLTAASAAVAQDPTTSPEHVDRTDVPFVTLDPLGAVDLDQAFALEQAAGGVIVLRYAIADVGWFVTDGDALDGEAWRRGTTMYLPDGKVPLYPPILSERAASLLPEGPRPAVVFTVRLGDDGVPALDGVERAVVRSRARLAYETVTDADLSPLLPEFAARMAAGDAARGAARVDAPEQQVVADDGGFRLEVRPRLASEDRNAAMSLATNLAVAQLLLAAGTGLFRVMAEPDQRAVARLRHTASAMGVHWGRDESLADLERRLDPRQPRDAAFMLAIRRAGGGASYVAYEQGVVPWHAAMAATYAHATAPLRRLADRHVCLAALDVAAGRPVRPAVDAAFPRLPAVMAEADALGNKIDRSVIDLAEAVVMTGREGQLFDAVVTDEDERGVRIQLREPAVVARLGANHVDPGDTVRVRLLEADPARRLVRFERVG